ncbi:ABC transporter ATP-binding protein [Trichothermofontia sichuanensis B231]|uniref:ABC transporter ATP-binding protein n=1 Tax=Trichothermofontia sichuanensis TaxID=3045816 RepID=UPI002246FA10|nr:ABC transporter ATP-binding protein [Trichothermofontia sichuanensis]UZQ55631.1 ABC transporter ATP-binding protein [Trichothermofontia sichuanensis B231]
MSQSAAKHQRQRTETSAPAVELRDVFKLFEGEPAVRNLNLTVQPGEFFSILGPSGCGKTTTLRLIAGFEEPSAGEVRIQGSSMLHVPPYRRPVNTVFQSYALFNHMTVWENVAFGLQIKGIKRSQLQQRVQESLKLVKMEAFSQRYPAQLSGGQQQRVALARALVNEPTVVLLDEPLGALDLKLRKEMQVELANLHQQLGVTFVMVTHDQEEALSLSDRIAVMNGGQIEQIGTPHEIYQQPATPFVADFIGDTNLLQGRVDFVDKRRLRVVTESGLKVLVQRSETSQSIRPNRVVLSIRPENIHLSLTPPEGQANCFQGQLSHTMYLGTHIHYVVELISGDRLTVLQPNTLDTVPQRGTALYVYWSEQDGLALPA